MFEEERKETMAKQKNIVFITADQLGANFVGCYGSGVASTPTLNRLAKQGMRFDRSYAHVPVCGPNRATFLTGRTAEAHGVVDNNLTLTGDHPTYAHVLKESGYRTGGFGKFHQTPMQRPLPESFDYLGFDESIPTEDTKLGPWLDWVEREHPEHYEKALSVSWPMSYVDAYGPDKRNMRDVMEQARNKHLQYLIDASSWRCMHPSPLDAEIHQTTYITDISLDFMDRHIQNHADQPFMCFVSYVDPHDPYDPPAPYDTMFDPDEMPDAIRAPKDGHTSQTLEHSRDFNGFRDISANPQELRKLRSLYHGSIRFVDDQIARIVSFLEKNNLMEDTVIVFTTDHGEMMGDHGLITKGVKHYDGGIRVPLIVCGSGIEQGTSDRLCSSLDLFPTFCDWGQVTRRPPLEGKSFALACENEPCPQWEQVTVQSTPSKGVDVRSIVTDDGWRFSVFLEEGYGEMFNLIGDPQELNNLYEDSAWTATRLELHERLTRAYMLARHTYQFPNLPWVDGEPCVPDHNIGMPLKKLYPSP